MQILVTGGAGYIGSVVVGRLLRAGHEVVVFDNLSHGHREAVPSTVPLIVGDIHDCNKILDILREFGIQAVMHFAAFIEAGESMRMPELFFQNNTSGTLALLEAMLRAQVNIFVFSSTAALYGIPENTPIRETADLKPTNPYGESKLLVERMLAWFAKVHGLRYASLRYFNAAGSDGNLGEDHTPETHLIPLLLRVAQGQSKEIAVFGTNYPTPDGTCIRDYIHVVDLATAHILALDALGSRDQLIYNVGNGRGYSVLEVISSVRRVTGHKIPISECDRRSGDPPVLVACSDKIQRELGWKPSINNLDEIVLTAWKWKRLRPNGYGGIPSSRSTSGQ